MNANAMLRSAHFSIFHMDFTLSDIEPVANWNVLYTMRNLINIFIPYQSDENHSKTALEYPNLKKYLREKKTKFTVQNFGKTQQRIKT